MPNIDMMIISDVDMEESCVRGFLSHVLVEIDGQRLYPVLFYAEGRLAQDLATSAEHGEPFIADPGMIVVTEVRIELMRYAVAKLQKGGFFDRLVPVGWEYLSKANKYSWPPWINGAYEWGNSVRDSFVRIPSEQQCDELERVRSLSQTEEIEFSPYEADDIDDANDGQ